MMRKAWSSIEEVPYCFSRSSVKFQVYAVKKKSSILTQIGPFQTVTPFEFTNGYEMMGKTGSSIEEVFYYFQGHLSNFKVTWLKKLLILTQTGCFRTITPVWILWWPWNDAQSHEMMHKAWSSIEEVPYCFSRLSTFKGPMAKKNRFWPKLGVSRL